MDDLDTWLQQEGLARVAHDLVQVAQPSIRLLSTAKGEHAVPLGASKLGGLPDLPQDISWPTWKDVPLAFIAQINLAEVHALDTTSLLPAFGLLSFFYDADHVPVGYDPAWREGWRVLYSAGEQLRLQRVPLPSVLLAREPTWLPPGQQYSKCALRFTLEVTLPPAD
jgi:uncharacterized protein YwqG